MIRPHGHSLFPHRLDNAVIENFFGLLKGELFYLQEFQSMEYFEWELVEYLDYYNHHRIKANLKGLFPAISKPQFAAKSLADRSYDLFRASLNQIEGGSYEALTPKAQSIPSSHADCGGSDQRLWRHGLSRTRQAL